MVTPPTRSVTQLLRDRLMDADLAALVWLFLEARLPFIVAAAGRRVGKSTVLEAMLDFLPPGTRRIDLGGEFESLAWLPEAGQLGGWSPEIGGPVPADAVTFRNQGISVSPSSAYLVAAELSDHLPIYTWGARARTLLRATTIGYGVGATIHADRLEEVHAALKSPRVGLSDDELSFLGVVLVLRPTKIGRRVVAAHYARPSCAMGTATFSACRRQCSRHGTSEPTRSSTSAGGSRPSWPAGPAGRRATSSAS